MKFQLLDRFHVDDKTGQVTVNVDAEVDHTLLDREKQDVHYVAFEAIDGGGNSHLVSHS